MINRCIGCYYHDSKENVCTHGSPIFIDDTCTDYQDSEFVKQIRADAVKDFAEWLPTKFDLRFANDCPKLWVDEYFNHTSDKLLEMVKE